MKYTPYKIPTQQPTPEPIIIDSFGGVDKSTTDTEIDIRHSPNMKNMIYDNEGILNKYPGYKRIYETALGSPINGLFFYSGYFYIASGTKLYVTIDDGGQPVEIYSGLANNHIKKDGWFVMNGKLYLLDGQHYLQIDGITVTDVTTIAYVPTLNMGRKYDGSGSPLEDFNLIGTKFIDSFSIVKDGSGVIPLTYPLSLKELDATAVVASKDEGVNYDLTEGTHFTVDRTNGTVTFTNVSNLPAEGTVDLLKIKAAKTVSGFKERITQSTFVGLYGGPNDTHVFFSGNPNYKNTDWQSGVLDPTYILENSFINVGANNEAITGYSIQYDTQVIHKENSKLVRTFQLSDTGDVTYPVKPSNSDRGLLSCDTLALIDNNPFGLDKKGICSLEGGTVRDERNVKHKSYAIDRDLLKESLSSGVAFDYDFKYWLVFPSGNAYVCDYKRSYINRNNEVQYEWFELDEIPATCFTEANGYLYFGAANGLVYRFLKYDENPRYHADGAAIECIWPSKRLNFSTSDYYKYIRRSIITLKPENLAICDVYYVTDEIYSPLMQRIVKNIFTYDMMDYGFFSYNVSDFPQTEQTDLKERGVSYFQLVLKNNILHAGMGLQSIEIEYELQGRRK